MSTNNTGNQWVWVRYSLLICLVLVIGGLARLTWWSFLETRDWFAFLDEGAEYVSLSLAVIFQYGQGPVLFLRGLLAVRLIFLDGQKRRAGGDRERMAVIENEIKTTTYAIWGLSATFVLFATIDAWTNTQEMWGTLARRETQGFDVGTDKYVLTAGVGIIAVFFEEIIGVVFSFATHTLNDIREIHGLKRIKWLDVFGDQARNWLTGDQARGKGGGSGGSGGSFVPRGSEARSFTHGGGSRSASFSSAPKTNTKPAGFYTPSVRNESDYHQIGIGDNDS